MSATIKIKNRTSWLVTIITTLALLLLLIIILIVIPLTSAEETYLLSAFSYILNVIPFIAFFILFFYIWLWNTFGKTILNITSDSIIITYKNKLLTKPKAFDKQEINKIETTDLRMESYKFGVRYHFSWTGATYSVVLADRNRETRIVDWIREKEANEIADKIKKVWY